MADVVTRLRLESTQYDSKLREASKELSSFASEARKAGSSFNDFTKKNVEVAKSFGNIATAATNSKEKVKELVSAYNEVAKAYNHLTAEQKNSDFGKGLLQSLQQLKGRIQDAKREMQDLGQTTKALGSQSTSLNSIVGEIGSKFGVNADLMGLLTKGTIGYTAAIGAAAMAVTAATKEFAAYNEELAKQDQITQVTTGLSGRNAEVMTEAARSLSKTYGTDFRETINAANTLMSQFGATGSEAINLLRDGMQGMIQGDAPKLLSMIQQFAPAFVDAGVSASELVAIIHNSEGGIFTDQNMSAIVMGIKNIRLMTKQTSDALARMGIDGEEMSRKMSDGSMTVFEALKKVAEALEGTNAGSREAGQVMQTVFGRSGAMNGHNLARAIAELNTNLDETKRQTGEVGRSLAQLELANEQPEASLRRVFQVADWDTMSNVIKSQLVTALAEVLNGVDRVIEAMGKVPPALQAIVSPIAGIVTGFSQMGNAADSTFLKISKWVASLMNPMIALVELLRAIGGGGTGKDSLLAIGSVIANTVGTKVNVQTGGGGGGGGGGGRGGRGGGGHTTTTRTPTGLIELQQARISSLEDQRKMATTEAEIARLTGLIEDAQQELARLQAIGKTKMAELGEVIVTGPLPPLMRMDKAIKDITERMNRAKTPEEFKTWSGILEGVKNERNAFTGQTEQKAGFSDQFKGVMADVSGIVGSVNSIANGIESLGIELPKGFMKVLNGIQIITSIMTAISTVLTIIAAIQGTKAIPVIGWALRGGGVVKAAGGVTVPGNYNSNDLVPAMLNSGEMVLNRAEVNHLSSALSNPGMGDLSLSCAVDGESLKFVLNQSQRRRGRGVIMTTGGMG